MGQTKSENDTVALQIESKRLLRAWLIALLVLFFGSWTWIAIAKPPNAGWIWAQLVGLASVPGKYMIFSGLAPGSPLSPKGLAILAIGTDLVVALTIAVFLGWLAELPWIGTNIQRVHDRAEEVLAEYPGIRRTAFWGTTIFVFLPLPASGAMGGMFVGQLVGLTRPRGLVAVMIGNASVAILFMLLATLLGEEAERWVKNPWVLGISVVLFALFLWIAWHRIRAALRRA
jgi:uncharacterized membrane protein